MLIIDDNADVRGLLRMVLDGEDGIDIVGEAPDGASGILLASDCRADVIVLDVNMPVMDGLTALPSLRRAAPDAAIVVWTASATEDDVERKALALGADAFVRKAGKEPLKILHFIRGACQHDKRRRGAQRA